MSAYGFIAVGLFVIAYLVVMFEHQLELRKSKPVIVAAGLIWALVALAYSIAGVGSEVEELFMGSLTEYAELLLFLLAAMTYVNTLEERNIFAALRDWLVSRGLSYRNIFWATGALAFFISPVADNLTTALIMAAVVIAIAGGVHSLLKGTSTQRQFIAFSALNIVIAANAGGAFSPFGDITTLMVWQSGIIPFTAFFHLFIPAVISWALPALIMSRFVSAEVPEKVHARTEVKRGGFVILALFVATIASAVLVHSVLLLPPVLGMMTGLGVLKFYGYYLKKTGETDSRTGNVHTVDGGEHTVGRWDIFTQLQRAEWDTLMFFYGVIMAVGGLKAFGYLAELSTVMYGHLGATASNVLVGLLSAFVDNIPVMFAILSMHPDMSQWQWLLVTYTAGIGGSMLAIGSAAGVAMMGQARGVYTFGFHLKWAWVAALGYFAGIFAHAIINGGML